MNTGYSVYKTVLFFFFSEKRNELLKIDVLKICFTYRAYGIIYKHSKTQLISILHYTETTSGIFIHDLSTFEVADRKCVLLECRFIFCLHNMNKVKQGAAHILYSWKHTRW